MKKRGEKKVTKYSCKDIIKAIKLLWEISYKILGIPAKILISDIQWLVAAILVYFPNHCR